MSTLPYDTSPNDTAPQAPATPWQTRVADAILLLWAELVLGLGLHDLMPGVIAAAGLATFDGRRAESDGP